MKDSNVDFKQRVIGKVKDLRLKQGLNQREMSAILNISYGQSGNIVSPNYPQKYTLKQVYAFCQHIDYPVEDIFLTLKEGRSEDKVDLLVKRIAQYQN